MYTPVPEYIDTLTGQEAYEIDIIREPFYHDGKPRKQWHQLGPVEQWSWNRNPTVRAKTERQGA